MRIVIDTNCLLSCIGKKSPFRNVFDAFIDNVFAICCSHEMLLEYEEKFNHFWGEEVTNNLLGLFETSENFFIFFLSCSTRFYKPYHHSGQHSEKPL